MTQMTDQNGLKIAANLKQFVENEALPGTGVDSARFWEGFAALVHDLAPKNRALLAERDRLQTELDNWHRANPGPVRDLRAYRAFLEGIGYIVPAPASVKASTANVDREIAEQGRFPAVNVLRSISRLAHLAWTGEQNAAIAKLRRLIARYEDTRDLRLMGGYREGNDPELDSAVARAQGVKL